MAVKPMDINDSAHNETPDYVAIAKTAQPIAKKVQKLLMRELMAEANSHTPFEQVLLITSTLGSINASLSLALATFGETYGMPGVTTASIKQLIQISTDQMLAAKMQ